jgi:hypothetical protein
VLGKSDNVNSRILPDNADDGHLGSAPVPGASFGVTPEENAFGEDA